jgi:hypothetical protein
VRLQGESGVAARLVTVTVTVDDLILAAPGRPDLGRRCALEPEALDERERLREAHEQGDRPPRAATLHRG